MSKRASGLLLILAVLCVVPLLLAVDGYRFTFDNPSLGGPSAPFTLEYFAVTDCPACREFELVDLALLEPFIDQGALRLIYRDLPASVSDNEFAQRLFCLQEYGDYASHRRAAKTDPSFDWQSLPRLTGRAKARHDQCVTTRSINPISAHNQRDFERRGFQATPSFTLIRSSSNKTSRTSWTGRPSVPALIEASDAFRADVTTH